VAPQEEKLGNEGKCAIGDEILMIVEPGAARGRKALMARYRPSTFTLNAGFNSAGVLAPRGWSPEKLPAFVIKISNFTPGNNLRKRPIYGFFVRDVCQDCVYFYVGIC